MTNADQPEDINARLNRLEQRVGETWERATINTETIAGMQQILQGLLTMTLAQQQTTANLAQSTASLERSVGQLTETVRTHDRQIQQILQYLRDRNGGSSPPPGKFALSALSPLRKIYHNGLKRARWRHLDRWVSIGLVLFDCWASEMLIAMQFANSDHLMPKN